MGTKANSEDPIEMQHSGAFHQGLHCCIREKQSSGTEIYHNRFTCVSLKNKCKNELSYTCCINIYGTIHQGAKRITIGLT